MDRPLCECCDQPMYKNGRGGWRCPIRARENGRRYYETNRDKMRAAKHRHYEANREKYLRKNREWREANKDRTREWHRLYYKTNRAEILERVLRYQEANPERVKEWRRRCYEGRKMKGVCARCGKGPAISEAHCGDCLIQKEAYGLARSL